MTVVPSIKTHLKKVIPDSVLAVRRRIMDRMRGNEFLYSGNAKSIFTGVYKRGFWGNSEDGEENYFSGHGSHETRAVDLYVSAVTEALSSFASKPDVVDLGCGDFAVGSRIRPYCAKYIACDVVDGLIIRNRTKFANDDVEFRVVDIVNDSLPEGEVAFVRQVLQHLSNRDIEKVVSKLSEKYRMLIISEHLPLHERFVPNLDQATGPKIRIDIGESGSGVILTEPPFNLKVKEAAVLCEVLQDSVGRNGLIRTNLYRL